MPLTDIAQLSEAPSWGIQEFAAMFDITPRTLRFYEDKGLLSPARQSGGRVYGIEDRVRVEEILRAKRLGFTLEDIKVVMDVADGKVTDKHELLQRQQSFQKVIKSLRRRRKDMDIVTEKMTALCADIDRFIDSMPPQSAVFKYAKAYDEALRKYMGDDFAA